MTGGGATGGCRWGTGGGGAARGGLAAGGAAAGTLTGGGGKPPAHIFAQSLSFNSDFGLKKRLTRILDSQKIEAQSFNRVEQHGFKPPGCMCTLCHASYSGARAWL